MDFERFVVDRSAALFQTAYLLTGDRHAAEDLLQSALAKTAGRALREPAALEAYVRRAMYHEQVNWWRRRGRMREVPTEEMPEIALPGPGESADLRLVMRGLLARLTVRQRTMLVLRYFEDMSETEIADVLGLRVGTVRSQIHRSLERLRKAAPELREVREVP